MYYIGTNGECYTKYSLCFIHNIMTAVTRQPIFNTNGKSKIKTSKLTHLNVLLLTSFFPSSRRTSQVSASEILKASNDYIQLT